MNQSSQTDNSSPAAEERTTLGARRGVVSGLLALAGFAILGVAFWLGWRRDDGLRYFFHSYLTAYCFFLSISLGALFFVALQHVTRAGWSVTVRRLAELLAANVLYMALLILPIVVPVLLDNTSLYGWTNAEIVAASELLQHKAAYLDVNFFVVRCVFYLAVWGALSRYYLAKSVQQDESADPELTRSMERLSPVALLLFALTITFASFDWLMSLDPEWFSAIYGVYYFSGAVVGFLAALILLSLLLQASGRLATSITVEHYHDLGKLLFAFVFFWGYIAFSQYMLTWYANIPEETSWYLVRQSRPWVWVSLLLLFGHLLIPFLGLLPRWAKRSKIVLGCWAAWLLVFHFVDLYWLVMPSLDPQNLPLGPIDAGCLAGLGCLYLAAACQTAGDRSLLPLADPRLDESLAFENSF